LPDESAEQQIVSALLDHAGCCREHGIAGMPCTGHGRTRRAAAPRRLAAHRAPGGDAAQIGVLLDTVVPERLQRLEGVLDDLARTCLPPAPADLAALTELDDLLERGAAG
jgi:hypothetical protein